jgi:hypothetical protein
MEGGGERTQRKATITEIKRDIHWNMAMPLVHYLKKRRKVLVRLFLGSSIIGIYVPSLVALHWPYFLFRTVALPLNPYLYFGPSKMGSTLSVLASLKPYHLLGYGMLLGTELYQSFFMTKICFQVLPRPAFHTLQKKIFPIYFALQGILVLILIITYPPHSVTSLVRSTSDLVALTFTGVMSLLNYFVYGPCTSAAMMDRTHQGKPFLLFLVRSVLIVMRSCVLIFVSPRNARWSEKR